MHNHPLKNNKKKHRNRKNKKVVFGSFRLHYNWCSNSSSHVLPVPDPILDDDFINSCHLYYDSTWNSIISTDQQCDQGGMIERQLSGYLHWLEEKKGHHQDHHNSKAHHHHHESDINEIDKLADKFIESCHEKFRLEKQESYRRFQEMMARSM